MYIYENHLGSLYTSDRELSYEERHCEQCGDTDWLIGEATTREEAWNLLKDDTDIDGSGGWDYDYVQEFLDENWGERDFDDYNYSVPKIEKYQVAWFDMTHGGRGFDESFFEPDEINLVINYVETVEDEDNNDRTRVFVHFDNGDEYELKLEKLDESCERGVFNEKCDEDNDYDEYDLPYEDETQKFIWGVKSWDCLTDSDVCLYTMNDIDLIYLKDEKKYFFGLETIYYFEEEEHKIKYLRECLDAFTKFMVENGYNTDVKPHWCDVFGNGMNTHFDSIEECYGMFKMLVNGYCER